MVENGGQSSGAGPLLKNRYQLGRVLGRGGMCIVYQAWDTRLQRNVAVKRLEPPLNEDARTRARFDREGRALAQLNHPNLVRLVDRGSNENEDYLVFEYIEGRSLKDVIREGHISIKDFGAIVGQVAEGLAAAHVAGIVHRDVKPQNILIDRNGHAKVSDFGIATAQDWTRVTRAGAIIGSARYMSPEQIRSKPVDARSDIYSLGVVMYEMLAGTPPFDGTNMPEIARLHLNAAPAPLSNVRGDLPAGLERAVMRCLEKSPDERWSSMDELLGALVGLGLYSPQRVAEVSHPHKRLSRRSSADERSARRIGAAAAASGATPAPGEYDGDKRWVREHARLLEKKRRAQRRWKVLGALVAIAVLVVVIVLVVTQTGAPTAPNVVDLTLEEAQRVAEQHGMTVEVSEKIATFDEPESVVLSQDPLPDAEVPDKILNLTVSREPVPVEVASIIDVDPEGDQAENREDVPKLVDGKESTSWSTEIYRRDNWSGLKNGVGLEFVLEEEATMIRIDSPVEGWEGELLQETSSDTTARLATFAGKSTELIILREPIDNGRIWFTAPVVLTDDGRYGVEISEIYFYK